MGWENRLGGRYYYQKIRDGQGVRSVYSGNGEVAILISRLETLSAQEKEERRSAILAERASEETLDEQIASACEVVDTLTGACLLALGFHTHKRQWRRAR